MSVLSETKHLAPGSECPPLKPGVLRVYSMRFCPYAERARLVLAAKNVPHEVVNVNLKQKPDWWTAKYAAGKVPVLELDGKVVPESVICCDLLEELYPQPALTPTDPWQKANDKVIAEKYSTCISLTYQMFSAKGDPEKMKKLSAAFNAGMEELDGELQRRGTAFFHGDAPGMLDFVIWPWMERFPASRKLGATGLPTGEMPPPPPEIQHIHQWCMRMQAHETVKKVAISTENHIKFFQSYFSGAPDYDMELGA